MKLLVITQKVDENDPVLGFFVAWIRKFSETTEKVTVICLEEGIHNFSDRVNILSLKKPINGWPKNLFFKIFLKFKSLFLFYYFIWKERKNYDSVLVHMNPEYIILGGIFWRLHRNRIALWYLHKQVDLKLRLAVIITNIVLSGSRDSFRLDTPKLVLVGHGIDTELFSPIGDFKYITDNQEINILSVGRISRIKNVLNIIKAVEILSKITNLKSKLSIAGVPVTFDDNNYFSELNRYVTDNKLVDRVSFLGPVSHNLLPDVYRHSNVLVNASDTGSLDKVVLEAMSCAIPVITSNEAYVDIVEKDRLTSGLPEDIARKISNLDYSVPDFKSRKYIIENHNIDILIKKIIKHLSS